MNHQHALLKEPAAADRAGYELFRRAVCERDDEAWRAAIEAYKGLVLATIRRHAAAAQLREDDLYWVNRAFQRFWLAVGPDRFEQFAELPAILGYLKMCAASVLLDELRARQRRPLVSLDEAGDDLLTTRGDGEPDTSRLDASDLWSAVREALPEPKDRLVAQLSFVRGYTPREIFARHPDKFATITDVYGIKRSVILRLRRDRRVREYL
jgi:hypothetical protein